MKLKQCGNAVGEGSGEASVFVPVWRVVLNKAMINCTVFIIAIKLRGF